MRSAFSKDFWRSISHSWGRFLAIAAIVALGAGFYAGLRMTAPDMELAADAYYDGTDLYDIRVLSTMGLADDDIAALEKIEGVGGVMGAYQVDAMSLMGGEQVTVSFSGNQAMTPEEQAAVTSALQSAYPDLGFELLSSSSVEASMGARFFQKCLVCFAITAVFLLVYIALRFRKIGGLAAGITAVIALMHDVLIAFCVFVVCGLDIDDIFIAVILTILGYSLNATIVVYDRVRENRRKMGPRVSYDEVMNLSMNQTLGRTVLTSLCTFLSLVVVLIVAMIYNIDTVVSFALPMMAGVAAGCFSSQFIAPNLFCMWQIHKRKQMDAAKQKA